MKLATFCDPQGKLRVGAIHSGDHKILDLVDAARRTGLESEPFLDMLALMESGPRALDAARRLLESAASDPSLNHDLSSVQLRSPAPVPNSIRDFVAFRGHILGAAVALRALAAKMDGKPAEPSSPSGEVPPVFLRQPNYYKGNRFSVVGTDAPVQRPEASKYLDYELEFGIFVGAKGQNISRRDAHRHIFGYTIFNDFSARDTQVREAGGITGPCKSKDFNTGNAIGPWIVTADEIPDPYNLKMVSRVNGETWCAATSSGMLHSFEDMIDYVSRDEWLHPGEFFGSGTVAGGTGMEIDRYLQVGDVVELEVEKIGVLRNRIVEATQPTSVSK
jgi:2-keto-4-pentenoate hydratase/2-oxohepta-3-ene-1,7-dioic acid hydratase in catechol pathway